jgi:hypothetical protein
VLVNQVADSIEGRDGGKEQQVAGKGLELVKINALASEEHRLTQIDTRKVIKRAGSTQR